MITLTLPFFDFLRNFDGGVKDFGMNVAKSVAEVAGAGKIDMELELKWAEDEANGLRLQAFSPTQSPGNRHPTTGEPAW